jgi:hypothetical protein
MKKHDASKDTLLLYTKKETAVNFILMLLEYIYVALETFLFSVR